MSEPIVIRVDAAPPAKDGAKSIRDPGHPHHPLVQHLRNAMREALRGREPLHGVPVRMDMHYWRKHGKGDALNLINGVADIIQRRSHLAAHAHEVWVLDDDKWIKYFHYSEEPGDHDRYELVIRCF